MHLLLLFSLSGLLLVPVILQERAGAAAEARGGPPASRALHPGVCVRLCQGVIHKQASDTICENINLEASRYVNIDKTEIRYFQSFRSVNLKRLP